MDFSLVWMPAVVFALTSVVLAVHAVACALSVCKRRLLMDAQRARELLEEGPSPSSQRATEPLLQAGGSRDRAPSSATGPLPPRREDGKQDGAQEYLLWRDKPGGVATPTVGDA